MENRTEKISEESKVSEGNRLIAEFMGAEFKNVDYFGDDRITEEIIFKEHPSYLINGTGRTFSNQDDLRYHSSFDWLMPVVEKIQSIDITPPPNYKGYRIEIVVQGYVKIEGFPMPTIFKNVSIEGGLINALWAAVVQFIQWYNLQSPNTKQ